MASTNMKGFCRRECLNQFSWSLSVSALIPRPTIHHPYSPFIPSLPACADTFIIHHHAPIFWSVRENKCIVEVIIVVPFMVGQGEQVTEFSTERSGGLSSISVQGCLRRVHANRDVSTLIILWKTKETEQFTIIRNNSPPECTKTRDLGRQRAIQDFCLARFGTGSFQRYFYTNHFMES